MTTWLSNSATSNKLKQTYVRGFIDVSGDVIIRNNNELNFYDNNTATKNFSINSQEISVYENGSYIDISNEKLTYIKDLSENVQSKLNEFQSKLGDISHNIDTDYAINIISNSNLVQINDSLKTNNIEANADVSLNNNVFIGGTTTVDGNIIPSSGFTHDLGSETNPFGSLYISNNTIFFQDNDNENSGSMKFDGGDITILKKGDPESNRKKLTTSSAGNKLGIGKDSRDAEADLDVSGDSILRGDVTITDNLTINGRLTANYSDNSIPVAAIDGTVGTSITVSTIKENTASKIISDVNVLRFDTDSGFDIDDLSNGAVKVKMNSTFKTWKVDGQQDLVAEGLDSMTLVAGENVVLTTYQDPKSLEIDVDFSNVDASLNLKANKRQVDASLNLKSDKTYVDASLNLKLPETNPTVTGSLTVTGGDVSFNKNLNVDGDTTLNGDLSIHGNLSVFQTENNKVINTTVNNYELIVSEDLSLNGNLSVSDNSVFNKNVDICGNLYAQYPANSIPLLAISEIDSKANQSYVDASLNLKSNQPYVDAALNLKSDQTYVDASLNLKTNKTYVDASLNLKSDQNYVDASLNLKSDQNYVDDSLNLKSDQNYVDASLNLKSDQNYVDASLNLKSDQNYVDDSLNLKSDQTYVDASLNLKSDQTYVDASLNLKLPISNPIVDGLLTVNNGDVSLNQDLNVGGNTRLDGDLSIHGNLSVFHTENNTVINTTVNNYDLIVSEDLSLNGELSVKDNASFNKNVTIAGNLNAQYPNDSIPLTAIDNIEIKADKTYVDSALSLKSDKTYVDNSLNLKLPISNPSVEGNLLVSNDANINGNTTLNNVSVSGATTLEKVTIDNSLNINSDITIDGMKFDIFKRKSTRGYDIMSITDITHVSNFWSDESPFSFIIMSGDGKTVAYKANMLSGSSENDRYIKIFKLDSNNNWNYAAEIVPSVVLGGLQLNYDGTRLIGSNKNTLNTDGNFAYAGVIYIFNTEDGSTITEKRGTSQSEMIGRDVAISGNGNAYVFTSERGPHISYYNGLFYSDSDATWGPYYIGISINYDGTIFAGFTLGEKQFVRVLSFDNDSINPLGPPIYNDEMSYSSIENIYLSQSGYTIAIHSDSKVFIYTYNGSSWVQKSNSIPRGGRVIFDKDDNNYLRIIDHRNKLYFYHHYYNEWNEESSLDIGSNGDCDEHGLLIANGYYNSSDNNGYIKIVKRDINTHLHQGYINVKDLEVTNSLNILNDASFNGRVDVCGNLYAQYPDNSIPTSAINGNIGIDTETDISLNANLNVGGHTTLDSTLNVEKAVDFLSTLTVDGDVSLNSNLSLSGDMMLNGNLTMDGTLSVRKTETVMNTIVNNYEVIITNDLSINGNMAVSGDISFNNRVDICGNLYAQYPNDSIPSSAIVGGVIGTDTAADLSFNGKMSVGGDALFNNAYVNTNLNVSGDILIDGLRQPLSREYELFDTFSINSINEITHPNVVSFSPNTTAFSGDGNCIAYNYGNNNYIFKKNINNKWNLTTQIAVGHNYHGMGINYDGTRIIANTYAEPYHKRGTIKVYNTDTGDVVNDVTGNDENRYYGRSAAISGDGNSFIYTANSTYRQSIAYYGHGIHTTHSDTINSGYYYYIDINYDGLIFGGVTYERRNVAILKNNNGTIIQLGSHINASSDISSFKLSDDGYTFAFSSGLNSYIYEYINNDWSQKGSPIVRGSCVFNKDTSDSLQIHLKPNMYLYKYENNDWVLKHTVNLGSDKVGLSNQTGMFFASDYYNSDDSIHSIKITQRDDRHYIYHDYVDSGYARVRKNAVIDGSLNVLNDASFNGRVDICGNFYAQYPSNSIPASAIIGPGINTDADLSLNAGLNVGGVTTIDSSLNVKKEVVLSSTLNVDGDVSLNSHLSLDGDMSLNGNLTLDGNLTMDGTLSVRETQSVMNTVVNNYEVIITNDLSLNGDMSISGNASFRNNVDICGNLYAQYPSESIPSSAIIGGITGVDKNVDLNLNAGFSVIGDASFSYVNIDNSMNVNDLFVDGSMFYNDIVVPINKAYELLDTFSPVSINEITHNGTSNFSTSKTVFSGDGKCVAYQYVKDVYIFKKGHNSNWNLANQIELDYSYTSMDINYDGTRIMFSHWFEPSYRKGNIIIIDTVTGSTVTTITGVIHGNYGKKIAISGDGNAFIYTGNSSYTKNVAYFGHGIHKTYKDTNDTAAGSGYVYIDINYDGLIFGGLSYTERILAILKNNNGDIIQLGSHIITTSDITSFKLSDDGYTVAFSLWSNSYVYKYINGNWSQKGSPIAGGVCVFNKDTSDSLQIYQKPNMYLYKYENNDWALKHTVDLGSDRIGLSDQSGMFFASDYYNGSTYSIKITSRTERNFIQHEYSDTKDLRVRGKTIVDGSLNVANDASFIGRVDICGNLYAQYPDSSIPPSAIDGVLGIDNNADISLNANMVVDGTAHLKSSLTVNGPTALSSTLDVSRSASLSSTLSVSQSTTLNSTLSVTKATTLNSTLYVSKGTSLNSTLLVRNDATFNKDANIKGNLIVDGDLSVRQSNSIMNTVVNNYEVIITNDLSLNGELVVSGDASFNNQVDICGNLYAQYPDNSIPTTAIDGDIGINSNADLSLNADVYIKGNLSVFTDVSLNGDNVIIPGTDYTYIPPNSSTTYVQDVPFSHTSMRTYFRPGRKTPFIDDHSFAGSSGDYIIYGYYSNDEWHVNSYDPAVRIDGVYYRMRFEHPASAVFNGNYLVGVQEYSNVNFEQKIHIYRRETPNDITSPPNVFVTTIDIEQPSGSRRLSMGTSLNSNRFAFITPVYGDTVYIYEINTSNHNVSVFKTISIPRTITYNNVSVQKGWVCDHSRSFAMSDDGNVIAFSAGDNIITYKFSNNVWSINGIIVLPSKKTDITLNDDGTSLIVNSIVVYKYIDGNWVEKLRRTGSTFTSANKNHQIISKTSNTVLTDIFNYIDGEYVEALSDLANQYENTSYLFSNSTGNQFMYFDNLTKTYQSLKLDDAGIRYKYTIRNSNLFVSGDASFNNQIDVSGNATFHNRVDICGNLYAQYPDNSIPVSALDGNVGVDTESDLSLNAKLLVGQDASFNANMSVLGDLTIDGTLQVRETESVINTVVNNYEVIITNDLSLNGELSVDGNTSFNNDLSLNGRLSVDGSASFTNQVIMTNDLSLNGDLTVGADASFNNNIIISNNLSVGNDASFNSNVTVLGDSSFNGRVDICGNFYAQYPDSSIPASAIIGGVSSGSNQSVSNLAFGEGNKIIGITDDVTFDDDDFALIKESDSVNPILDISANLYVAGDISFNNGSVLIPTPLTTDNSNSAITIGYVEDLGYITSSGLLRQFEP